MTFEIIIPLIILAGIVAVPIVLNFRYVFDVPEGHAGLVYHHRIYIRRNNAGRHVIWGRGWTMVLIDLRKTILAVAGQDVLTADNVSLKLSLLATYQIADPAKAVHETQNWTGDLYQTAQLATRAVVNSVAIETLLGQKLEIGAQLLARVQPETAKIGINVLAIEVRDVMLPPDLKRAFADVLKAKQEGQAALERARGETAALRHLANAARVMDGNPALMNLRLMQTLTNAQNAGHTLVLGVPGGFVPLNPYAKPAAENDHPK
ncbi:MAG TPA: slipin family protein [Verrucomicrobiae bacterium]|jgi:regulator of protease activity HflC (stomatin/prohibitin superfamily)